MTLISVAELKADAGKYVTMAMEQDIMITKNGKVVAKLVTATTKVDKKAAARHLLSILPKGLDIDPDKSREERLGL